MSLIGADVRIIVSEPKDWGVENLFGTILSDRGGLQLIIKLSEPVTLSDITSELIKLKTTNEKQRFKRLGQYYAVEVDGALIQMNNDELDFAIKGIVSFD